MLLYEPPRYFEPVGDNLGELVAVADFDSDGRMDLFVNEFKVEVASPDTPMRIFFQDANGAFATRANGEIDGTIPSMQRAVKAESDFNGDGTIDIALIDYSFKDFTLPEDDPAYTARRPRQSGRGGSRRRSSDRARGRPGQGYRTIGMRG